VFVLRQLRTSMPLNLKQILQSSTRIRISNGL